MKKNKWIVIIFFIIVLIYLCFNPLVVNTGGEADTPVKTYKQGEVIKIFKDFNFDSGRYEAYIIVREQKTDFPHDMPDGKVLKTKEISMLNQMKEDFVFTYTGSDMATVENMFLLFENGKLVFSSGIVLDKDSQGFQNSNFGWVKNTEGRKLSYYCKQFKRVYTPVIIL